MSQTCSVVAHGLRGLPSNRKLSADIEREAVSILSQPVYRGFGPTLAAEYLAKKLWFSQNPIRLMIPREVGLDLEAGAKIIRKKISAPDRSHRKSGVPTRGAVRYGG